MLNTFDYNIRMLRNDVGIFTERGGTIAFLLSKDGIVVIDAQFPDTAQHLIDDLKKRSNNPFRYLLNTHHHMDHTAGNIAFKGLVEQVVAHGDVGWIGAWGITRQAALDQYALKSLASAHALD